MDDKYNIYAWASGPMASNFIANAIIQWLLWPFRIILEVLTGSPLDNIVGVEPID